MDNYPLYSHGAGKTYLPALQTSLGQLSNLNGGIRCTSDTGANGIELFVSRLIAPMMTRPRIDRTG